MQCSRCTVVGAPSAPLDVPVCSCAQESSDGDAEGPATAAPGAAAAVGESAEWRQRVQGSAAALRQLGMQARPPQPPSLLRLPRPLRPLLEPGPHLAGSEHCCVAQAYTHEPASGTACSAGLSAHHMFSLGWAAPAVPPGGPTLLFTLFPGVRAPVWRRPQARRRTRLRRAAPCSGTSRGAAGARPAARCCRPRRRSWMPCRCPSWAWCCRCGLALPGAARPAASSRIESLRCGVIYWWCDMFCRPGQGAGPGARLQTHGPGRAPGQPCCEKASAPPGAHAVDARRPQEEAGAAARWRVRLRAFVFEAVGHLRIGQVLARLLAGPPCTARP